MKTLNIYIALGMLLPLIGTTLGSACVFFINGKKTGDFHSEKMTAFAAGVMTAASIWSLLIPAIDRCESMGKLAFVPAVTGFWAGAVLLILLDFTVKKINIDYVRKTEKTAMLVLAVAIHNIPEGMAVGAVLAGLLAGAENISVAGALTLSLGIAIQNLPEGAIISLPLQAAGGKKTKSFGCGVASGVAEPLAALITIILSELIIPALPFMLSFAAGAMIYVVIDELINETTTKDCIAFSLGFTLMMALDVALG